MINIACFKYINLLWIYSGISGSFFNLCNLILSKQLNSNINPPGQHQPQYDLPKITVIEINPMNTIRFIIETEDVVTSSRIRTKKKLFARINCNKNND